MKTEVYLKTKKGQRMKLIVALLLAVSGFAQTATVVRISKDDAAETKRKYDAYLAAKAAYEKAEQALKDKYMSEKVEDLSTVYTRLYIASDGSNLSEWVPDGEPGPLKPPTAKQPELPQPKRYVWKLRGEFTCGVEFTEDFRFAVPANCPVATPGNSWLHWTPALGSTTTLENRLLH